MEFPLLHEDMATSGFFLFRWRSYLPLLLIVPILFAAWDFEYLFENQSLEYCWLLACLLISLAGEAVRIMTVGFVPRGTSGRNTTSQRANELNTTGIYSVVRHPLYLGNFLIIMGIVLAIHSLWLTVLVGLIYWLYYERIMMAEESFLKDSFADSFTEWSRRTPAIIPNPGKWERATLRFSTRTVLRREYNTIFAIFLLFTLIAVAGESMTTDKLVIPPAWLALLLAACVFYVAIWIMKHFSNVLRVEGR